MGRARLNGQSCGAKINGIIKEYIIQAGNTVSAGDFVEFIRCISLGTANNPLGNFSVNYIKAAKLNDTEVMICYRKGSDGVCYASVLNITSATITQVTTPINVSGSQIDSELKIKKLTDTTAIIAYTVSSNTVKTLKIVRFNGTSLSLGGAYNIGVAPLDVLVLSGSTLLFTYCWGSQCLATILTFSGTSITTRGTDIMFFNGYSASVFFRQRADGTILVGFDASNYVGCVVFTISGTTISAGSVVLTPYVGTSNIYVWFVSDIRACVLHLDGTSPASIKFYNVSINGNTITIDTTSRFLGYFSAFFFVSITNLSSTKSIMTFASGTNPFYHNAMVLNLIGDNIIPETRYITYSQNVRESPPPIIIGTKKMMNIYSDGNQYIVSRIINIIESVKQSTLSEGIQGVSKTKGSAGEMVKVFTLTGGL
ncbi:hypothetical protein [Acetobacterium woodii]|uniref:Uncharacterized protein n=1 Tax=Acetobacterium woodii (strain ATCC 29683 / DSM 1030 / JCM 2381 / KCTC 1655 / WB1) TaxID=931626 RepID=H6LCA6_ACEWD|nr:hypothetical protein [Acetobacterium woodii]AFA50221.1 hypothetical protein Awo_c34970 [Acetobacterium woodii DSM 1030]